MEQLDLARQLGTFTDKLSAAIGMRIALITNSNEGGMELPRLTLSQPVFAMVRGSDIGPNCAILVCD